jgi:hypothetical protein
MESKFSVIIPTMFKCPEITSELLNTLYEDDAVSEVILIDNTVFHDPIPNIPFHHKLKMHSSGKNLYVNPSWNYGVELAKENLIAILNDDIVISNNLFSILSTVDFKEIGIIGACHPMIEEHENPKRFDNLDVAILSLDFRSWGFGIFMAMHKEAYTPIPEDMLIWCGDDYIFHQAVKKGKENYVLYATIKTKMSTTSNNNIFDIIKDNDVILYENKYKLKNEKV